MCRSELLSEISALEEELLSAMRNGNLSFLESVFSKDYIFLGSDGSTWGKDRALEDFRNPGFKLLKLEVSRRNITVHDNTAIVTGISTVEGQIGEKLLTGKYLFMRVWTRAADSWRIAAVSTWKA